MIEVDYGEKTASDSFEKEDPMMVLMEFMRIKNFRLIDLFKSLDADGSHSLTRKEFKDGLLVSANHRITTFTSLDYVRSSC